MFTKESELVIHKIVLDEHGDANGTRDNNGLESAIGRPFQTFDAIGLYATCFEKAAAIGESIIINHPFIDGNKRTRYVLMEYVLRINNYKIISSDEGLYQFVIQISTGHLKFDETVDWLKANSAEINL
ncbi:MAG: type II toxin-antitoxin system death-on-curing family toxin [Saprospiraceae bacterium]|nr:type II toxin-antitoxin system death-on-curing family toxin [Candidatus Brachybacter algidus]MBL0120854.1 type II toxin-antitoxin system death-on-curing family toxin [Candidatus Brachybacter algidus]